MLSDNPALARIIEKQVRNWELARAQHPETLPAPGEQVAQFVTIANIVGAGGNEVANTLSELLGWPLFDRQILTAMAGDDEVRARLYRSLDERSPGWFESIFRSLFEEEFRKEDYFHRLTETILVLARQGPTIFVGRSADLILPKNKGLRVKVIASRRRCAENFAKRENVSLEEAQAAIERIEEERRRFVSSHFSDEAHEPTRFDLLINVERFSPRQAVDLIVAALHLRGIVA